MISNKTLKNLILFFLSIITLNYLIFSYRFFERENGYILGDWLVNYNAGFVKRGFIGSIILKINEFTGIDLKILAFYLVNSIFIFFIILFFKKLNTKNLNTIFLIMLFSPATFLFNFYDPLAVGRKEILFLTYFMIYNYFFIDNSINIKKYIFGIFAFILTLTHEMFFLLIPFIFVAKYLRYKSFKINYYYFEIFILILSSLSIFLLIFYNQTDPETSRILCKSLTDRNLTGDICWGIIGEFQTSHKLIINKAFINDPLYFKLYSLYLLLILGPIIAFLRNFLSVGFIKIIFFILITLLPIIFLFLLVNDWGRYLNVFAIMWMIVFLFHLPDIKESNYTFKLNVLSAVFIVIFTSSWYMQHCCPKNFNTGFNYMYQRINFRLNDKSHETTRYGKDIIKQIILKIINY